MWQWAWTLPGGDDGFLAYDRNVDGLLDGSELFGDLADTSEVMPRNGFHALSALDSNADKYVDAGDEHFADLFVWLDTNHDGVFSPRALPSERVTLAELGISSIDTRFYAGPGADGRGNDLRWSADMDVAPGHDTAPVATDVFLAAAPVVEPEPTLAPGGHTTSDYTLWTCFAWSYSVIVMTLDEEQDPDEPGPREAPCAYESFLDQPDLEIWDDTRSRYGFGRLVAYSSTSTWSLEDADRGARARVAAAFPLVGMCQRHVFDDRDTLHPDPYLPPPYRWNGDDEVRVKCSATQVHTSPGGGGGGGGPTCTD